MQAHFSSSALSTRLYIMKALSLRPAMTSRIRTVAVSPLSVPYRRSTPPCFSVDITYMQKEHSVRSVVHSRHFSCCYLGFMVQGLATQLSVPHSQRACRCATPSRRLHEDHAFSELV